MPYSLNLKVALATLAALTTASTASAETDFEVNVTDANRFVEVFEANNGMPDADALQSGYLDNAGIGVRTFTPNRIVSAENLAERISQDPDAYRRAIDVCLPIAQDSQDDLNTIYARLGQLLPGQPLPEVHVVFGAGNSGGTAGPGVQVLGLEVICDVQETEADIRAAFRMFFAHETVHAMQDFSRLDLSQDPLLAFVLIEGIADYVAWQATGEAPSIERDQWASQREAWLWAEFQADRQIVQEEIAQGASLENRTPRMNAAAGRWIQNFRNAPEGWPHEAGYWVGRQIITAYLNQQEAPAEALLDLLSMSDPIAVLAASEYDPQPAEN
ncbi:MAG: hypothetical protein GYB36_11335 [Alphaproteobacteria bacterium]|nr:hypothetical protein [Alphaproteobacteria bacterium]